MNDILFDILQVVIIAAITALLRYLIPYFTQLLRAHNYTFAAEIVETLVRAAEQMILEHGAGSRKYELVVRKAREELEKYNIHLTDGQLDILIESAVQVINESKMILEEADSEVDDGEYNQSDNPDN